MSIASANSTPRYSADSKPSPVPPTQAQAALEALERAGDRVSVESLQQYRKAIPRATLEKFLALNKGGMAKFWVGLGLGFNFLRLILTKLPLKIRLRTLGYLFSPKFLLDMFNRKTPYLHLKKLSANMGAPVLKTLQAFTEVLRDASPDVLKKLKLDKLMDGFFKPMLDSVHPTAQHELQPYIDELLQQHNTANPDNPVHLIGKKNESLIGSGSVAQIYRVTAKDGTPYALKIFRPELFHDGYLRAYREFTIKLGLLAGDMEGLLVKKTLNQATDEKLSAVQQKKKDGRIIRLALKVGSETFDYFKDEVNPIREKLQGQLFKDYFEKAGFHNISFPQIITATRRAFLQTFVKGTTLNQANEEMAIKAGWYSGFNLLKSCFFLPIKHLDLHEGNVMIADGGFYYHVLDYGRSIKIPDEQHQQILQLCTKLLSLPSGKQELESLRTAIPMLDHFFVHPEKVPLDHKLRLLKRIRRELMHIGIQPYSFLHAIKITEESFPTTLDLSRLPLSATFEAMIKGGNTLSRSLKGIVTTPDDLMDDAALVDDIRKNLPRLDLAHFFEQSYPSPTNALLGGDINLNPKESMVLNIPDDFEALLKLLQPSGLVDSALIQKKLEQILQSPSESRSWLLAYYRLNRRIHALAKEFSDELLKITDQAMMPDVERQLLVKNVESGMKASVFATNGVLGELYCFLIETKGSFFVTPAEAGVQKTKL